MVPNGVSHGHCDCHHRVDRQGDEVGLRAMGFPGCNGGSQIRRLRNSTKWIADCPRDVWWFSSLGPRSSRWSVTVSASTGCYCRLPYSSPRTHQARRPGGRAGAFTVFLITMIAISHPGSFSAGEMRVIDVALGVSVSLIVSAFMWPHGAAAMVRRKIAEGADHAGSFPGVGIRTADPR